METLRTEGWSCIPDDRQTKLETIGGSVIQDFGHNSDGDAFSCRATLSTAAAVIVANYWHNREPVTVRDSAGMEMLNMRVIVKKYGYIERFEQEYFWADLEFWRI